MIPDAIHGTDKEESVHDQGYTVSDGRGSEGNTYLGE
jgi:hypothetical protein